MRPAWREHGRVPARAVKGAAACHERERTSFKHVSGCRNSAGTPSTRTRLTTHWRQWRRMLRGRPSTRAGVSVRSSASRVEQGTRATYRCTGAASNDTLSSALPRSVHESRSAGVGTTQAARHSCVHARVRHTAHAPTRATGHSCLPASRVSVSWYTLYPDRGSWSMLAPQSPESPLVAGQHTHIDGAR